MWKNKSKILLQRNISTDFCSSVENDYNLYLFFSSGKHYRMFDDKYVEFENATKHCEDMGARLPVLDSPETIEIIKKYLETSNFTVFEQWDRSSRRVWLGLNYDRSSGLHWADGRRIVSYPASSR